MRARLAVQQSELDQSRAILQLKQRQVDELKVRAGFAGVLQLVPVEVGQQVAPGTNLARVANPVAAESRAQDRGNAGQGHSDRPGRLDRHAQRRRRRHASCASIRRCRTAPSPWTSRCTASCREARVPDLSVDGTIELERLADVLYVGRPAFGQEQSTVGLFKVEPDGSGATRVQVKLGRSSVNTVEVAVGAQGRRSGDPVGHVRVGRVRSRPLASKRGPQMTENERPRPSSSWTASPRCS